mmetsp:Transcript_16827/g.13793  ORF Transcript_16827/g.13793 Transcript_16827/m.13793 type:complete len:167 (-) Transcript_16827:441-941(-)
MNNIPTEFINDIKSIDTNFSHTCVLIRNGEDNNTTSVRCWGDNSKSQCDPPSLYESTHTRGKDDLANIEGYLYAGYVKNGLEFACSLSYSHLLKKYRLICWGDNSKKQLDTPLINLKQYDVGSSHGCLISLLNNSVICWGANMTGQADPPQYNQENASGRSGVKSV